MPGKDRGRVKHRGSVEIRLFLQVREKLGFTQKQMALMLSVTPRQYGRVERGEVKAPRKTWLLFCMFALMMIPGTTINVPEGDDDEWLE